MSFSFISTAFGMDIRQSTCFASTKSLCDDPSPSGTIPPFNVVLDLASGRRAQESFLIDGSVQLAQLRSVNEVWIAAGLLLLFLGRRFDGFPLFGLRSFGRPAELLLSLILLPTVRPMFR
jgi:hypothetical protein